MNTPVLSVEHLSIHVREDNKLRCLIDDIHFSVDAGQTLALVGESGSGKSLTARAIMQLLNEKIFQQKGVIRLQKKDGSQVNVLDTDTRIKHHFRGYEASMIFQEPMTALNPVMRIGDQIMETLHAHQQLSRKAARSIAIRWLEKVQLPDPGSIMHRYPHQLSGGQKQRVMIAMAMCCEPALLIADEPTTALDTITQKEILSLIRALQHSTGMALLFITHDLGIVRAMADQVAVMHRGKIVEYNSKEKLFDQPQHPYTRTLMACRTMPPAKGEALRKQAAEETGNPAFLSLHHLSVTLPGKRSFWGKQLPGYQAIHDVSLHVNKGETVGLVGESGSGKTTVSRVLLGLTPFQAGEIIIDGQKFNTTTYPTFRERYKVIQVVFQDPYAALNPRIRIGPSIEEPLLVHRRFQSHAETKQYVLALLEKVRLDPDLYDRYPHQLSGGQRQRLVIARALALQPDLIIWDESVSALDVRIQAEILNLLNELKVSEQFSSLFISHDLSVIRYISDRIYVMQQGRIVESGIPEQIWTHPREAYTRRLLDAVV